MKAFFRFFFTLLIIAAFLSTALPCGPGYVSPLFDTTTAPENPYLDYAAGRLGIVKPTYQRSVLYAAYRYIVGSGMSRPEQEAMVAVWKADIDNKDFRDDSVDAAVKLWVDKRKDVVEKEEKVPDIYATRAYGGYQFFPNCTKNAFETAAETLSDRASAHGPTDPGVQDWIRGQDQVFENCSSGKQTPALAVPGSPDWLVKDRAYQIAAASFYSLDYRDAKRRFGEIAQDTESPWAETADYLVARTLIRQASLTKSPEASAPFYDEAEIHLQRSVSRTGKFTASSEKLLNLVKYRRHPKERVAELGRILSGQSGNENFRQDVIDYNWLLDKFATETLAAEDRRKETEAAAKAGNDDASIKARIDVEMRKLGVDVNVSVSNGEVELIGNVAKDKVAAIIMAANESKPRKVINNLNRQSSENSDQENSEQTELQLYTNDTSYQFSVKPDATDDDAIAAAEKAVGKPLTDEQKTQVRGIRQTAYAGRFTENRQSGYEGGYYGEEKLTPSILPDFLRQDEMTDWLFTYQMTGIEAYFYSLNKFKANGSELWLMTALSKADKSSNGIARLIDAASNISRTSLAYPTVAYHQTRILLSQGKQNEARVILDQMINAGDELPISARNAFIALRLTLAETLDDFLKYSLKKPFAFDFDGDVGTINEFIDEQKKWYDPETNKDGREAYDAEVEQNFKEERLWQERLMFDEDAVEIFNQHFPTTSLIEVEKSHALPDYMRERFAMAIWTRSFLLDNYATLLAITPEVAKYHPEFDPLLAKVTAAKTQAAMDNAALYFVLKNPILSPYLEEGMGKTDNEQDSWSSDDWWCAPYDTEYNETTNSEQPKGLPRRPVFLTAEQSKTAQKERSRLKEIGDAPKFLAEKVKVWAKLSPADRRIPEALYIIIQANGWTKYGCGNDEDLRNEMAAYLKKRYPTSEWTAKLISEENDK